MRLILSLFLTILFALPAWAVAPQPTMQQTIQSNSIPAYSAPLWQPNKLANSRRMSFWNIASVTGTTYTPVASGSTITVFGTATSGTDSLGTWITSTTGTTSGNQAGSDQSASNAAEIQTGPIYYFQIESPPTLATLRLWIGLFSSASFTASDSLGAQSGFGYRFSTVAGDTTFQKVTGDGTTQNTVASSVTVTSSTFYIGCLDASTAGQVTFYLNGVNLGTISTHLPAGSTALQPVLAIETTNTGTAVSFKIGTQAISSN